MNFDFDTRELDALLASLTDDKIGEVCAAAVNDALDHGVGLISESVPVGNYITPDTGKGGTGIRRGGRLRQSIDAEYATPESPSGKVFTTVEYAPAVEWGTGIYSDMPGAPRAPITIKAKNPRTVMIRGKAVTIVALTFYGQIPGEPAGSNGWTSLKEVTIRGMAPRAPFRNALPAIQQRLNESLRRRVEEALRGG